MSDLHSLGQSLEFASLTISFLQQEVLAHLSSTDVSKVCGPDLIYLDFC